jgi:hypothetical protein
MLRFTRAIVALTLLSAALVVTSAAPASAWEDRTLCHHPTWGGTYFCKYHHEVQTLADGTIYFVVVNANYQVWARWRNPNMQFSKWTSLGGTVWHGNPENDGIPDGDPNDLASLICSGDRLLIEVRANNGDYYWRMRFNDGSWSTVWVNYDHSSPDC